MNCCVGIFLEETCSEEVLHTNLPSLTPPTQEIVYRRIRNSRGLPVDEILTICSLHTDHFVTGYDTYQRKKIGCCNPFKLHSKAIKIGIEKANDDLIQRASELDIEILVGQQICEKCYDHIMRRYDGELDVQHELDTREDACSSLLSDEYAYDDVQTLYASVLPTQLNVFEKKLKSCQAETIYHILRRKDVLCILPTNYGKTLPMIMAGYIYAKVTNEKVNILIISPLKTLMADLTRRLNTYNLKSITLNPLVLNNNSAKDFIANCEAGDPVYIISSPELLKLSQTREILKSNRIMNIMVDECHLTSEWGKSFRTDYGNIHEIRQYLDSPLALFTATLSNYTQMEVISNTGMRKKNMIVVSANPDRPEIFLELRVRESFEKSLKFLVDEIVEMGMDTKKTLVFVQGIKKTDTFNLQFRQMLYERERDFGRIKDKDNRILGYLSEHFSASTEVQTRGRIIRDFSSKEGYIRVLFSTVSYGLGMDNPLIDRVICYETDNVASSTWQKISRGSRRSQPGQAIIFTATDKLTSNTFFKPNVCMRKALLIDFAGYLERQSLPCCGGRDCCPKFMCCSICRKNCTCDESMEVDEHDSLVNTQHTFNAIPSPTYDSVLNCMHSLNIQPPSAYENLPVQVGLNYYENSC